VKEGFRFFPTSRRSIPESRRARRVSDQSTLADVGAGSRGGVTHSSCRRYWTASCCPSLPRRSGKEGEEWSEHGFCVLMAFFLAFAPAEVSSQHVRGGVGSSWRMERHFFASWSASQHEVLKMISYLYFRYGCPPDNKESCRIRKRSRGPETVANFFENTNVTKCPYTIPENKCPPNKKVCGFRPSKDS
jgi:hypothetical protein